MSSDFPALPGFYKLLFLYLEPGISFVQSDKSQIWDLICIQQSPRSCQSLWSGSILVLPGFITNLFLRLRLYAPHWIQRQLWLFGNLATVLFTLLLRKSYVSNASILGYLLLGLISSLVFRAVRDNTKTDLRAQENILRASLTALALADVCIPCLSCPFSVSLTHKNYAAHSVRSFAERTLHHWRFNLWHFLFSIAVSFIGLPPHVKYNVQDWNGLTHGNITVVIFLFAVRSVAPATLFNIEI